MTTRTSSLSWRLLMGAAAGAVATAAYRSIQFVSLDRAVVRDSCWAWEWLPFHADWIWPYLSMFVIVGLPWFLLESRDEILRFAARLFTVAAIGWVTFMTYPTACARPAPDGQPFYYALLLSMDRPNNCLPCLHSAFSLLAALTLVRGRASFRTTRAVLLLVFWLLLICVSIVALRQHTDVDTLVGLALGWFGARVFRPRDAVSSCS